MLCIWEAYLLNTFQSIYYRIVRFLFLCCLIKHNKPAMPVHGRYPFSSTCEKNMYIYTQAHQYRYDMYSVHSTPNALCRSGAWCGSFLLSVPFIWYPFNTGHCYTYFLPSPLHLYLLFYGSTSGSQIFTWKICIVGHLYSFHNYLEGKCSLATYRSYLHQGGTFRLIRWTIM